MTWKPTVFGYQSEEYLRYRGDVQEALAVQNLRNQFTKARRLGKPFDGPEPPTPNAGQMLSIITERDWRRNLADRSDTWWFRRIDKAIEERHWRSFVYQIIWWDRADKENLNDPLWKAKFADYDHDRALEADWDMVEYALHCAGYSPYKAHLLSYANLSRKEWLLNRYRVFKCFECDNTFTNLDTVPTRCLYCGKRGCIEETT